MAYDFYTQLFNVRHWIVIKHQPMIIFDGVIVKNVLLIGNLGHHTHDWDAWRNKRHKISTI